MSTKDKSSTQALLRLQMSYTSATFTVSAPLQVQTICFHAPHCSSYFPRQQHFLYTHTRHISSLNSLTPFQRLAQFPFTLPWCTASVFCVASPPTFSLRPHKSYTSSLVSLTPLQCLKTYYCYALPPCPLRHITATLYHLVSFLFVSQAALSFTNTHDPFS